MSVPIERVVLTIDAASESRTAIDTAIRLAARTKAPLHAIFVEDEDFLQLAALPFARQFTIGAGAEPLTRENAELHSRAQAERARRELFAAAKQHGVTCTFEIRRGASWAAAASITERDLIVVGGLSPPVAGHFRVERHRWLFAESLVGPVLVARTVRAAVGSVVAVLRNRDAASVRLLEAAAQIAAAEGRTLNVICPPAMARSEGFDRWIADRVAARELRVEIEAAPVEPGALPEWLQQLDCRLLAVDASIAEGRSEELAGLIRRFVCDMLIVP